MLKDFNSSFHDRDRDINDKYTIQRHFNKRHFNNISNDISITYQCIAFEANISLLVLKMLEGIFLAVGTRLYSSPINLKKLMRVLFLGQWSMKIKALLAWKRNKPTTERFSVKILVKESDQVILLLTYQSHRVRLEEVFY